MDTGASRSIINAGMMSKFRGRHTPQVMDITLTAVNGDRLDKKGRVQLPIDKVGALEFIIMPGIEIYGIIGCDFLDKYNATVRFARNVLTVGGSLLESAAQRC